MRKCFVCVLFLDEVAHIKVPIHTVFKLTPVAYGMDLLFLSIKYMKKYKGI